MILRERKAEDSKIKARFREDIDYLKLAVNVISDKCKDCS